MTAAFLDFPQQVPHEHSDSNVRDMKVEPSASSFSFTHVGVTSPVKFPWTICLLYWPSGEEVELQRRR